MYDSRTDLENAFRANVALDFLFFWGHQPDKDGKITSSCLSQWWPSAFEIDGVTYATAEHWMMSEKARLFGDHKAASRIQAAESPKEVKQIGRTVRGFDSAFWDIHKLPIVQEGSFQKFRQNDMLGEFLLSTGDRVLVEASPVDAVWGIGLSASDEDAINPPRWRGENLLGFALMHARQRLRQS